MAKLDVVKQVGQDKKSAAPANPVNNPPQNTANRKIQSPASKFSNQLEQTNRELAHIPSQNSTPLKSTNEHSQVDDVEVDDLFEGLKNLSDNEIATLKGDAKEVLSKDPDSELNELFDSLRHETADGEGDIEEVDANDAALNEEMTTKKSNKDERKEKVKGEVKDDAKTSDEKKDRGPLNTEVLQNSGENKNHASDESGNKPNTEFAEITATDSDNEVLGKGESAHESKKGGAGLRAEQVISGLPRGSDNNQDSDTGDQSNPVLDDASESSVFTESAEDTESPMVAVRSENTRESIDANGQQVTVPQNQGDAQLQSLLKMTGLESREALMPELESYYDKLVERTLDQLYVSRRGAQSEEAIMVKVKDSLFPDTHIKVMTENGILQVTIMAPSPIIAEMLKKQQDIRDKMYKFLGNNDFEIKFEGTSGEGASSPEGNSSVIHDDKR